MPMIKLAAATVATIVAVTPAVACDLEMNGAPHRFFAFASQLAAMQKDTNEEAPDDRRSPSAERNGSSQSRGDAEPTAPAPEPVQSEGEQTSSDAATFR